MEKKFNLGKRTRSLALIALWMALVVGVLYIVVVVRYGLEHSSIFRTVSSSFAALDTEINSCFVDPCNLKEYYCHSSIFEYSISSECDGWSLVIGGSMGLSTIVGLVSALAAVFIGAYALRKKRYKSVHPKYGLMIGVVVVLVAFLFTFVASMPSDAEKFGPFW